MSDKKQARQHHATFARDKRRGGYMVRVEGPNANRFAGRVVPVSMKDGQETQAELDVLIWSGPDKQSGKLTALYSVVPHALENLDDEITF